MKLTEEQLRDPLWQAIRKECEGRLAMLRKQNDVPCGEAATAERRGKIMQIKELLRLDPEWID